MNLAIQNTRESLYTLKNEVIGQFFLFPNGKNMNEMLVNPFEWSDFIKSFS